MGETFDWLKPSTLWERGGADMLQRDFFRPALHEFRTDKFMEEFLAAASAPASKPFRETLAAAPAGRARLKLFQPAHGNFYLTSASLCCHIPGFPDREVRTGEGESVFFVLRKKVGGVEFAWNASETKRGWQSLGANPQAVPDGEERLPLFQAQTGKGRQLFFGYVPVASQDTYAAAVTQQLPDPYKDEDPRIQELDSRFIVPLKAEGVSPFGTGTGTAPADTQLRISVYLLLDLWEYYDLYLPEVAAALRAGTASQLAGKNKELADFLKTKKFGATSLTMEAALREVANDRAALNEPGDADLAALGYTSDYNMNLNSLLPLGGLRTKTAAALKASPETTPAPVALPKLSTEAGDLYVLRYVYERAQCVPPHRYLSRPTEPFELAPFFDPEAPGRSIRIGLPVDVSIAGLRKFKKNVGFIMSKELNDKVEALKGQEKEVLDDNASVGPGGVDVGWICSFSLPIITLCAFILLMIIVILLNIVFWWIPLLKICFPIPLFAKK